MLAVPNERLDPDRRPVGCFSRARQRIAAIHQGLVYPAPGSATSRLPQSQAMRMPKNASIGSGHNGKPPAPARLESRLGGGGGEWRSCLSTRNVNWHGEQQARRSDGIRRPHAADDTADAAPSRTHHDSAGRKFVHASSSPRRQAVRVRDDRWRKTPRRSFRDGGRLALSS